MNAFLARAKGSEARSPSRQGGRAAILMLLAFLAVASMPVEGAITQIAVGGWHSCALSDRGAVKCWGYNHSGQLGDGTSQNHRATPVDVLGLQSGVRAVSAGAHHTCALTVDDRVKCWGAGGYGQLGDGAATDSAAPVDVVNLAGGVSGISAGGYHTCALMVDGAVMCWGRNTEGQLGRDPESDLRDSRVPNAVWTIGSGASSIAAGSSRTCAITAAGSLACWSRATVEQECVVMNCILFACPGPPIITCRWVTHVDPSPEYFPEVPARSRAVVMARVSAASSTYSYQACVITASGGILCQPVNAGMFRSLAGLDAGLVAVDPGRTHACSLDASGRARCWGSNASGALGDPAISVSDPPGVTGSGLASGVTGIGAGADFSCALKSSGEVLCWGSNTFGQLGDGTTTSRPVPGAVRWQGDAGVGALSGMWLNPAEPGWGVSLTQHRDVVFAVLYTYDAAGDPRWLVAPECRLTGLACPSCVAGSSCAGALYDARGPRLDRFDPGAVTLTPAGQMRLSFSSEAAGVLGYDAGGVSRSTAITRFVFGAGSSPTAVDYTDHWYNPSEPGWGIALTQQSDLMFVVWFSYDEARMPVWYVASACRVARTEGGGECSGDLLRTTGPPPGPVFDASRVRSTAWGTLRIELTGADRGLMRHTLPGSTLEKPIARLGF